jgi:SAM-dependent methyltransferase
MTNRIRRLCRNIWLDWRTSGAFLGGSEQTRFLHLGAANPSNSDYGDLARLLPKLIQPEDVVVDVGCGKGRVLAWGASHFPNRFIGIELDPDIAASTRRRLKRFPHVEVRAGDVRDAFPAEGTLYYLFCPFGPEVTAQFRDLLALHGPPDARVLYVSPQYLRVWQNDPRWHIQDLQEFGPLSHEAVLITRR